MTYTPGEKKKTIETACGSDQILDLVTKDFKVAFVLYVPRNEGNHD